MAEEQSFPRNYLKGNRASVIILFRANSPKGFTPIPTFPLREKGLLR